MTQLKVGGKTPEILEEQAVSNCKPGLLALLYVGFSKPDKNSISCVKAAYVVLRETLSGFIPVSRKKHCMFVKTEREWAEYTLNCEPKPQNLPTTNVNLWELESAMWQAGRCVLVGKIRKKKLRFIITYIYYGSIQNYWETLTVQSIWTNGHTEEHAVQGRSVFCKMIKKTKQCKHRTYSTTGFATNLLIWYRYSKNTVTIIVPFLGFYLKTVVSCNLFIAV